MSKPDLTRFILASDRIVTFGSFFKLDSTNKIYLKEGLNQLNLFWTTVTELSPSYHKAYAKLEAEGKDCTSERESLDKKYYECFEIYCTISGKLQERLLSLNTEAPASTKLDTPASNANIHLPPCDIESFKGDFVSWPAFRDLFTAVYINNSRLQPVEKLYHLLQKTKGEAYEVVKQAPLSNSGFDLAWSNLSKAYENKRVLTNIQLDALFTLQPVTTENSQALKTLVTGINSVLSSLNLLGLSIESWSPIVVHHCCRRLPDATLALWEQSLQSKTEIPSWESLSDFLNTRCLALNSIATSRNALGTNFHNTSHKLPPKQLRSHTTKIANQSKQRKSLCVACSKPGHKLWHCPQFQSLSPQQRLNLAKSNQLCINCLSPGHSLSSCGSKHLCTTCSRKHHSLLHFTSDIPVVPNSATTMLQAHYQTTPVENVRLSHFTSNGTTSTKTFLLGTAVILIEHGGFTYPARALIDPASEVSFIVQNLFNRIQLPWQRTDVQIAGVTGNASSSSNKICSLTLRSPIDSRLTLSCDAYVLPHITSNIPSCSFDQSTIAALTLQPLADQRFHVTAPIDILLGSDMYPQILKSGVMHNILGSLVAQETVFGWVLTGPMSAPKVQSFTTTLRVLSNLDKQLRSFWEIEEIPTKKQLSASDQFCETLFRSTTYRNAEGRYVVSLPFKETPPPLGHSRAQAMAQFRRNELRLTRNPDFHLAYSSVIREYLLLNHMHMVSGAGTNEFPQSNYYLPHHPVIKPDSSTTSLRVVFNASSRSANGKSLNDTLHAGPALQADLTLLLIRWRLRRYVFVSDITKMYRQILVNPEQTKFQRMLYRFDPSEPIADYELKTVTFGVNCAPFLAIRTLLQLAEENYHSHPLASKLLRTSLYVDDVLAGYHDEKTAIVARDELIHLLKTAGFSLHKWMANSPTLLSSLEPNEVLREDFLVLEEASSSKTLGVRWNGVRDDFFFLLISFQTKDSYTKREILSMIARLFDPVGWLAPVIVTAKILMQQIWLSGTNWDDAPPTGILDRWKEFLSFLPIINKIRIPRWVGMEIKSRIQIHGFCDASEKAYAGTVYLRCETSSGATTHLILAKTRVAPIKTVSLPRLELCGALLLANMVKLVLTELKWTNKEVFCWTDSTIVLSWLQKPPCAWATFVAVRVAEIQRCCGIECWRHVISEENPADLSSRGTTDIEFPNSQLWWHGPSWLSKSPQEWPAVPVLSESVELERKTRQAHVITQLPLFETMLTRFSNYSRTLQVFAYVFRFLRLLPNRPGHPLTSTEVHSARNILIRSLQRQHFAQEYTSLQTRKTLPSTSSLLTLCPMIDKFGVMRVNGRLVKSSALTADERSPIILPYVSHFSKLLVKFIHEITLHGGNQLVLRSLRQEFWIPRATNLIKFTIQRCKICILWRKKSQHQVMAALPSDRCALTRPFHICGVDFAGPFEIKSFSGRFCRITKGYVCIFVCFATKAIHLEATSDLSTDCFLGAFNRFISRRGCPFKVYSDNGTVFVGASRAFQQEFQSVIHATADKILGQYSYTQVSWHFIPPGAPHMGGLWEAGVKSFKTHFRKTVANHRLTFEEFSTVLARIEACLNSRPLTAQVATPEAAALPPGHFLIGAPLLSPAEPTLDDRSLTIVNRWKKVKALSHILCTRWKEEYLQELHRRYKWKHPTRDLMVDDIVVVQAENLPPTEWRLG